MAPRLALWLVACLGVCAGRLAAVGAAPAPHATQEPEIVTLPQSITLYYHQLASSWAPRPDTILGNAPVFHGSEGTSLARVDPANASVMVVHQREMDLSDHSDHRLGGSFGLVTPLRFGPVATFNPLTTRPVVSPSRDGPMLLFFMENSIQALIEGTWQGHSLSPSQSILAWHSLGSKFLQVLLFDSSSDHLLVLALSHGQSPAVLPAMGLSPGVARERLHAVSGVGPSFVFWFDDIFGVVALPWGGAVILGSSDTPPGGTIVDLAASTILNSDQGDIALLHQDRVSVCLNHTPLAECETWFHVARPPGLMPGSAARLYLPAPGSLHEPVKSILFQDTGTGQLWWLHFDTLRRSPSSWQRLLLPNGLALSEIVALRPVRLAIRPGFSTWGVGNAVDAFVASGDFLCIEDSSILCGRPSEPRGYACAPGWAPSHGLFPGQLCGACLSGHRRIGQYGAPASCSPCAGPHCRQCLDHQGCVLCEEGFVLFLDPSTRVSTCLDSCPAGYSSMASGGWRCLPTDRAIPPPGIRPQTIVLSDFPASPVEFFVPSLLCSVNGVMHLLPENRSPSLLEQNLLAFRSTSQSAPLWIRVAHDGSLTSSTMDGWPFSQAGPGTSPPAAQSYVEVVLASQGSGPRILSVLCDRTGNLRVARMECRHRPPTEDDPCEVAYFWEFDRQVGCLSVGLLGKDIVSIVMTSDVKPTHIMPVSSTGSALDLWPLSGMHGHPVEFPVGWFPRDSPLGDWAFAMPKPGTQARVLPAAMLRKMDSRVAGFPGATLHPPPSGYEPILLATGLRRSDGLGEFFLAGLAQSGDGPMLWEVWHFPAPGRDTGLIVSMPHRREILGQLPSGFSQPGDNPQGRFFSLALAPESEYPAAMLLVTRRMVGWARLYCPMGPGERVHCWLEPASFAMLDRDINALPMVNVLPLPAGVAEAQLGPSPSRAVFMADGSANIRVLLLDDGAPCVAGTEGPLCQPCDSLCLACSASGPEACTACRLSPFDRPGVCVDACPEGLIESGNVCVCAGGCVDCASLGHPHEEYHCRACPPRMAPLGGTCQPCHSSCTICTAPGNPSACVFCSVGSFGTLDGRCLASCPEGTWADIPNAACWPCPTGCTQCVSGSQCTVCSDRRFLAPGGQCERCEDSCASCENAASCTDCQPGLVFLDTNPMVASLCGSTCAPGEYVGTERCMACGPTCALCAGAGDACAVCAAGHRWSGAPPAAGGTGACVPCPDGCDSCTASRCLACEQGLFLDRHEGCVQACPLGTYNDGPTGTCQPCDVSCAACAGGLAGECTGCAAGLELVATEPGLGTCESGCPEGQYRDGVSGECLGCDPACATCNGPTDKDCWRCTGQVLQDGECVQTCAGQHVALAGRCLPCHPSCEACSGVRSTECVGACPAGLQALPAGQTPTRCVAGCPVGYNTSAGGCSPCGSSCASCPLSAEQCVQCERGKVLAGTMCVNSCPLGTSVQGGLCSTCHGSCLSCYGPAANHCLSCRSGAPLLLEGACLSSCPEGTTEEGGSCVPCPVGCSACTDPATGQCSVCRASWVLLAGTCVESCPPGQYAADAELGGQVCRACDGTCLECSGPGPAKCSACPPGLMLHEGRCVGSCPVGMFECLLAGRCEACPAGCTACTVAEESPVGCAAACSACQGGLFLSFATGECLPGCPPGEYALAGAFSCARCHASCRSCFEREQFCTSCPSDEAWLDYEAGVCLSACPERPVAEVEFPNALPPAPKRACLPCPDGCDRCRPRSPVPECVFDATGGLGCPAMASCDLCATGLLLLQGSACVSVCPEGFFADVAEVPPTCSPCHRKCSSCVGPEAEDCTDRSPGSRRLALGLGIGLGVLLVLLLLLVVLFLLWRVRQQRSALNKPPAGDDENATVLNTMVELSLPGSILVDIGQNFAPLAGDGLGAGTQARVFAARAVGAGTSDRLGCPAVVAIKQLKTDRLTASQGLLFQNEVALMWLLRDHGNIVRLYGYSETPPAIIMDRFDTDLGLLLHSEAVIEDAVLLDIIQQWATGLEAMHTQGVAHRDLKPGNVLVSQRPGGRWHAALGDLGASRNLNTDRSSALVTDAPALNALTARYAAPEVLTAVQRRRGLEMELLLPADIFSAAIMLWECLTRTTPWAGKTFEEITADVLFGHRPDLGALRTESNTPQVDLLQMAWDANPHVRPVAASFRQKCAMQAALHR